MTHLDELRREVAELREIITDLYAELHKVPDDEASGQMVYMTEAEIILTERERLANYVFGRARWNLPEMQLPRFPKRE